jgi:uncharacterized protein
MKRARFGRRESKRFDTGVRDRAKITQDALRKLRNAKCGIMRNPFQYGGVVEGAAFCNRKQELADLTAAIENSEKLFVYAERRLGKTSLVRAAVRQLPKKHYASAYIDLFATDGEASFVEAAARAIAESMTSTAGQLLEVARQFFSQLAPSVTADSEGKPKITFGFNKGARPGPELEEVLAAPEKIAARHKRRVVVVFDEVQELMEYGSDLVERRLRSIVQRQKDVSYIFLGSRKHLIEKMFLDRSRPLYRAAGHYPLESIAAVHWIPFIARKFRDGGKTIGEDVAREICKRTQGHPFYTQHFCHALWELCDEGRAVDEAMIEAALNVLLDRESYAYTALWESFPLNQKRLLKGLASQPGAKPFSSDFLARHGLGSPSNAQRAAEGLLKRDLIDRDGGSLIIGDRFFRLWIERKQAK